MPGLIAGWRLPPRLANVHAQIEQATFDIDPSLPKAGG